ncbi:UNC93-like protein 2, partial [Durusdinium trenchii]
ANPFSYFAFVLVMLLGAALAPVLLAEPSSVQREDGSPVLFSQAESPLEELHAAWRSLREPFILRNLLFYLASNWFYTYNFNGFNGHQFNIRTRGLNSAAFWAAQMWASSRFGQVLDSDSPPRQRAQRGMLLVAVSLLLSLGLALQDSRWRPCQGHLGWDKGQSCRWDVSKDFPQSLWPMAIFLLLGASDAIYQNYAYWLMSMAAGGDVRKTVMYSAAYKGVQSLGAGMAWLIDLTEASYFLQGSLCLVLTLGACLPVLGTFHMLEDGKKEDSHA